MYRDRQEAGQKLGIELAKLQLHEPVVLALPRGGVPVAAEVAKALNAPLDLIIVRKVGAPGNPELAVAAIVDGDPPDVVLNREIVEAYSLGDAELGALIRQERPELDRRRLAYRGQASALVDSRQDRNHRRRRGGDRHHDEGGDTCPQAPGAPSDHRGYPRCAAGYRG